MPEYTAPLTAVAENVAELQVRAVTVAVVVVGVAVVLSSFLHEVVVSTLASKTTVAAESRESELRIRESWVSRKAAGPMLLDRLAMTNLPCPTPAIRPQ